jgi:hypothetical protein
VESKEGRTEKVAEIIITEKLKYAMRALEKENVTNQVSQRRLPQQTGVCCKIHEKEEQFMKRLMKRKDNILGTRAASVKAPW